MADRPPRDGWSETHETRARTAGHASYEAWIMELEAEPAHKGHPRGKICAGWASSRGQPCTQPAGSQTGHLGTGRCKWHFGSTRQARRKMPARILARRAEAVRGAVDLLTVREERATAQELLEMQLEELEEAGVISLRGSAGDVLHAIKANDPDLLLAAVSVLETALNGASRIEQLYSQIADCLDLIRRLTETEARIVKMKHDVMTREQAGTFLGRVSRELEGGVFDIIGDRQVAERCLARFSDRMLPYVVPEDLEPIEIGGGE